MAADFLRDAWSYWVDANQRTLLYMDVMQQRGERFREQAKETAPHVLNFECQVVMDGRKLAKPVNYALVRIIPPRGVELQEGKRPFVVVDPRAGHGPGIGGFKADSEIGVALRAGHPCYFIGFLPEPEPEQSLEDVARAEAAFLERVIALHPEAEGKPAVIGNCQAGWAVMLLASVRPELFGPIILAGSPLSYWAGVHGRNPMRYLGGLLGGSWMTALMSDLGNGKFDGAWLVANFESMNPANTLWSKQYNLYSKVDTEAPRYLEFEEWWGNHTILNGKEIQFIVDELFIGNKLGSGEITMSDGLRADVRNIRSPIVVFCSNADDITPPQQALGWILDAYNNVDDVRARGQTIVYCVHHSAGHLGIFVSGSVATKEHNEFASNIDLIDVLPPGLYEAVMTPVAAGSTAAEFTAGDYLLRFEARTLDDIRALGGNSEEDDRKFATVARVSEINLGLYRTFAQPWIKVWAGEGFAKAMRDFHPLRVQYEMFSSANPYARLMAPMFGNARENRQPVARDNIYWKAQEQLSDWVEAYWNGYRDSRDRMSEAMFDAIYGSPIVQAAVGLKASDAPARRKAGQDAMYKELVTQRLNELRGRIRDGGARDAVIRALLYIRIPEGVVDERGFRLLQLMHDETASDVSLADFKKLVREQFFMLLLDERRAVDAIPAMIARDGRDLSRLSAIMHRVLDTVGLSSRQSRERLDEIEHIFEAGEIELSSRARDGEEDGEGARGTQSDWHSGAGSRKH
jgi:pimeloyl-ACP methyl ester carboxylesterase